MGVSNPPMDLSDYFDSDGPTDSEDAYRMSADTSEYNGTDRSDDEGDASDETAPIPGGGKLLEEPDETKVFKAIHKQVEGEKRLAKNREERAKHWELVRGGCQFSILEKSEDLSFYKQVFPPGVEDTPQPIPNKVDDLCNKIISQLLVDPFIPNPKPDGDSDRARGAADLTKKFLRFNATADNCNDAETFREVLNGNMTKGSLYTISYVDPMGGGWRPKQIKAHPQATDPSNPLVAPKLDKNGQPITIQTADGPQPITETTSDPILRYVTEPDESGVAQFTNDPSAAARQWLPKIKRRVITPAMVRMFPRRSTAFEAREITVLMWDELGEAKRRFRFLEQLDPDTDGRLLKNIAAWRPTNWKALVPEALRDHAGDDSNNGEVSDRTLIFWYHHFCRIGSDYVDGGEIAVSGALGGTIFKRDTLREDVELEDGTTVPVLKHPPISQFRSLHDAKGGDPNGEGAVARFGGAIEIYAHLYVSILEAIDKGLHPIPFIPATSPVTREDLTRRDGRAVEILTPEDKPTWEQPPTIPDFTPNILERVDEGMNSLAGTNQTSNGLDSEYAKSGVAKQVSINQAKVALAQQYQGFLAGACYMWQIETQLAQAHFTVPQLVKLTGQDSAFKQRWWVGSDLVGVSQIALEPGTGTMMTAPEKANFLGTFQQYKWLEPEVAGELARSSMADDLGLPPNVHEERIAREIGEFSEGPPNQWLDDFASNQQQQQQYQTAIQQRVAVLMYAGTDQQTAMQQAQQDVPAPQPKPLFNPFSRQANDLEPGVAKIRAVKLSRFMDTVDYSKQPVPWRKLCETEYQFAFHNAGGLTVDQQAASQQPPQDPNEPTFQKFVQDTTRKVVAAASKDLAGAIATLEGLGPKNTDASAPIQPDTGPSPEQQATMDAATQTRDQQHQSSENAKQRAHEAIQNDADRALELHKHALSQSAKLKQTLVSSVMKSASAPPGAPQNAAVRPAVPLPAAEPNADPQGLSQ